VVKSTADRVREEGILRWPELDLPLASVARHVREDTVPEEIRWPGDLYLALACAEGVPLAISIFEKRYLCDVDTFVAGINATHPFADEVKQRLRERLLVGPAARIKEYRGLGPLSAWLRVASLRIAVDLVRSDGGLRTEPIADVATRALDPELGAMRGEHRPLVEKTIREAVANLSARQRNVLRMHFVSGWSFARIARSYGVHRATAMRWISEIKEYLLQELIAQVGGALALDADQLGSWIGILQSQIDASLSGLHGELSEV
jgi:RNA polymerase sigma-70 factor (ECF subfamily)